MGGVVARHAQEPIKIRRINKSEERHPDHVIPAIPQGSGPIQTAQRWITDLLNDAKLCWRRNDFRRNVLHVAELLLERCDFATYTVTPGRDWLETMSGLSRATVTRCLRWLRDHGFLGMVANGRMAENTPRSADEHARWPSFGGGPTADRAVYVMCQPMTAEERLAAFEESVKQADNRNRLDRVFNRWGKLVDVNEPPPQTEGKAAPKGIKERATPVLKEYLRAATEYVAKMSTARTDLSWPRHRTTSAQDEAGASFNRLQAARTVKLHTPVLASLSDRHLARILKPFFVADWTAADVIEAISFKLDGSPWQNDAAYGVRNVAAWLQSRLSSHRLNGMVTYSPGQRREKLVAPARERALAVAKLKLRSTLT